MPSRKAKPAPPGDVPSPIVAALLIYLVTLVAPLVSLSPDLPSTVPPISFGPAAIISYHRDARPSPALSFVDESFAALTRAAARHDGPGTAMAQREFVAYLSDARATSGEARAAIRERHLRDFLRAFDTGRSDPLLTIAQRHRLAGMYAEPGIDRAMLIAWFDFRWEALAAPEILRSESVRLPALVERIPLPERRAITSWVLSSSCETLLGLRPGTPASERELAQCASARNEFVDVAASIDAGYPAREAHATVDVLHARDLVRLSRRTEDGETRAALRSASHDAFERAHAAFTALAETDSSRRIRRFVRGTLEAASAE